jgi:hypothetical protein
VRAIVALGVFGWILFLLLFPTVVADGLISNPDWFDSQANCEKWIEQSPGEKTRSCRLDTWQHQIRYRQVARRNEDGDWETSARVEYSRIDWWFVAPAAVVVLGVVMWIEGGLRPTGSSATK